MEPPSDSRARIARVLPFACFAALTIACFGRFLVLGQTLYDVRTLEAYLGSPVPRLGVDRGDTVLTLPILHRIYGEGLHHGELRLWNPYLFCGAPIYDSQTLHAFYPPNLLLYGLLPPRIAYDLSLLLHFFFSGAAMYALLRGLGRSRSAATAGGLIWMLFGYNALWFSAGTFLAASVFAPLAALGLHRGLQGKGLRFMALAGAAQGLTILGSHGQLALHLMIFFSLWLGVNWVRRPELRVPLSRGIAVFWVVSIGIGAAGILTELDALRHGFRTPGADLELHYGAPWMLLTHLSDLVAGKVHRPIDALVASEFAIYAGTAGTMLAWVGAIRDRRDPWTRYIAWFAVSALLVAFVRPLAVVVLRVPFLNLSMPARWLHVFGFCLSILAAAGLDALREKPGKACAWTVGAAALFLVPLVFGSRRGAWGETFGGLALVAAGVAALYRFPRIAPTLLTAALLVDLVPAFLRNNRHADPAPLDERLEAVRTAAAREKEPWRASGGLRRPSTPPATETGWTAAIGHNLLALQGVEAVMGYESIAPAVIARYCRESSGAFSVMGSGRALAVFNFESRLLDLANMKYVFMPSDRSPGTKFLKRDAWGPLSLYENPAALPRAYLASKIAWATGPDEAVRLLADPALDVRTTVVLEAPSPSVVTQGGGAVSWRSRSGDRLELETTSAAPSVLVLSETDHPGWEAELDGREARIYRANLAFRAVAVPAGTHVVVMSFRPGAARAGLLISAVSALSLAAFLVLRRASAGARPEAPASSAPPASTP